MPGRVGLNHVAIAWPDRESWLKQLAFLQSKGVPFLRRVNHGMTHSVYIADPDGHGIEVLYELPREVWEGDIDGAQNYAEMLPTEGAEALIDRTENPVFSTERPSRRPVSPRRRRRLGRPGQGPAAEPLADGPAPSSMSLSCSESQAAPR